MKINKGIFPWVKLDNTHEYTKYPKSVIGVTRLGPLMGKYSINDNP